MSDRVIYVSNTEEFNAAFEKLSSGGTVSVTGEISLEHTRLPRHYGKITVTGDTLSFDKSVTITLGGETVFENITVDVKSSGVIAADFHPLTFGNGVNVVCDFSEETNGLYLVGGENNVKSEKDVYEKDTYISVKSGKISRMVGFSRGCAGRIHTGHADLEVSGDAYVRYLVAGAMGDGAVAGSASLTLCDNATIEAVHMGGAKSENTLSGDMDLFVYGGDIYRFDTVGLSAVKGKRKLVYDPQTAPDGLLYLARLVQIDEILSVCDKGGHKYGEPFENPFGQGTAVHRCSVCGKTELIGQEPVPDGKTVYVADGGFGNGASADYPMGDLYLAQSSLSSGGVIVLVGKCTLVPNLIDPFEREAPAFCEKRHKDPITVTCVHDGVDYRSRGACLFFDSNSDYRMSGPVTFENMRFVASKSVTRNRIIARYNPLVIGYGCQTTERDGYELDIIGGYLKFRFCDFDGCEINDDYEQLVSLSRPLPLDLKIDNLKPLKRFPNLSLRSDAALAFDEMFDEMERQGLKIPTVTDAMRPYYRQYSLFTGYLCRLRRTFGYDFKKARSVVMRSCAVPCSSEHQYGVAVDMFHTDMTQYGSKKHHYFDITPEWAWVHEFGKNYGIVLRYPPDKTSTTGCIYEAWHFRYVGVQTAKILMARGYVLEEYMGAKLGLFNLDSKVEVRSGSFNSITAFSLETGLIQLTGKHFLSVSDDVKVKLKSTELSEC